MFFSALLSMDYLILFLSNIDAISLIYTLDAANESDDIIQFVSGMHLKIHITLHNPVYCFGVQAIN